MSLFTDMEQFDLGLSCTLRHNWPASDAHLTGDQEVAGSIPAGSGNILSWRNFPQSFSPFH